MTNAAPSQAGLDAYTQKARDYGRLAGLGVKLGEQQLADLRELGDWPSLSEHIRRAVDLYLRSQESA